MGTEMRSEDTQGDCGSVHVKPPLSIQVEYSWELNLLSFDSFLIISFIHFVWLKCQRSRSRWPHTFVSKILHQKSPAAISQHLGCKYVDLVVKGHRSRSLLPNCMHVICLWSGWRFLHLHRIHFISLFDHLLHLSIWNSVWTWTHHHKRTWHRYLEIEGFLNGVWHCTTPVKDWTQCSLLDQSAWKQCVRK